MIPSLKVLRFEKGRTDQAKVGRHYRAWRQIQKPPLPMRCDNPECRFYLEELKWNEQSLKPVLDHINGVNGDSRPSNLRYLCPNCHSQQRTSGGGNKGRVKQSSGGFAIRSDDDKSHHELPAEPGNFHLTGNSAKSRISRVKAESPVGASAAGTAQRKP